MRRTNPRAARLVAALLPLGLAYVRQAYRRIARGVATQVEDYATSGFTVLAVVGIDGSPTCGVHRGIDVRGFVEDMTGADPATLTTAEQNRLVRKHASEGSGIFIEELERELRARHLRVPFLAHDLLAELQGAPSSVTLGG
jgi:hypothetical protein